MKNTIVMDNNQELFYLDWHWRNEGGCCRGEKHYKENYCKRFPRKDGFDPKT